MFNRAAVDEHRSATWLLPAVWFRARPGLVALFSAVEALALGIVQQRLAAITGLVLAAAVAALGLALSSPWWSGRVPWLELWPCTGLGPGLKPIAAAAAAAGCALEGLPNSKSCLPRCDEDWFRLLGRHATEVDIEESLGALVVISVILVVLWLILGSRGNMGLSAGAAQAKLLGECDFALNLCPHVGIAGDFPEVGHQ
jgi:hypothetical protein